VVVSVDDVSKAVKGLPKLSGCGCSGDTVDFWKLALKYEDMIDSLTDLFNQIANGHAHPICYKMMSTSRMNKVKFFLHRTSATRLVT